MKKTAEAPKKFMHLVVYLGIRLVGQGLDRKRYYAWSLLKHENGRLDDETNGGMFSKNPQKRATPGSVFLMQGDESGQNLYVNSGEYRGRYRDEDTVVRWLTMHRAAEAEAETMSKVAHALRRKLDLERLEPIRVAYSRASSLQRGLIVSNVVKFITGGVL